MRLAAIFGRRPAGHEGRRDAEAIAAIKAATVRLMGLSDGATLTVSEIRCLDPGCPDLETIILIMRPGCPTEARKVAKPVADITEQDLAAALA